MIRVALVEDEESSQRALTEYLERFSQEINEKIHVSIFPDGAEIVEDYRGNYDIILMDILMRYMDGMEAASEIRKVDKEVVILFITSTPQYVMKGYTVDALDYVLKPVSYGAFCTKLSRAIQRVQRRKGGQGALQLSGGGMQLLDTGDILYLETRNRMLYYHTATQKYAVRGSLAGAEKQLAAYHFARCNQCYLVNLQYVRGVENDFVQGGDARLEISRRQKAAFMTAVASYLGGVL